MNKWKTVVWQDVLTIQNGRSQKKVVNSDGAYPIYGSGGIMGYADDYLCEGGTTIIGRKGSINNPLYVKEKFWNVDTAFGLCAGEELDGKFLYYFCVTYNFFKHNKATTLPSLTKRDLLRIKIPLPPLAEQQKIAAILDVADQLRQKDAQLIGYYTTLSQSLFLEMFGDPVTNPKGWENKPFKELCLKITDGTHHSPKLTNSGIPYVTAKHVKPFELRFFDKPTYVSQEDHDDIYARCSPEYGDVLYIKDGATTGVACMNTFCKPISLLSSLALLKTNHERINNYFLCFWLNHNGIKEQLIQKYMSGAAIKRYTLAKINTFTVMLPPIELQNQFAQHIEKIEQQKQQAQAGLEKSEALFNSLLQRAFKGELTRGKSYGL